MSLEIKQQRKALFGRMETASTGISTGVWNENPKIFVKEHFKIAKRKFTRFNLFYVMYVSNHANHQTLYRVMRRSNCSADFNQ